MKKVIISLLSIVFIISMITNIYAATGTISSGASADTVIKGKTFTVTIAATADSPIDGMYTKIDYDKNVLNLESASAGENYGNNSSDGEILVSNNSSSASQNSATLYTLTFKVLDNTNAENTEIKFSNSELHLNVDGSVTSVPTNIASVTVSIKADDTTVDNQGGTNTEPDNKKDDTNLDNTNADNTKKDDTKPSNSSNKNNSSSTSSSSSAKKNTTTKKLPQTGIENTTLIAMVSLIFVSIISFISYKKYKNI